MMHPELEINIIGPEEDDGMMDHCALELMNAMESKDKEGFKSSFHALVSDIMYKLEKEMQMHEEKES